MLQQGRKGNRAYAETEKDLVFVEIGLLEMAYLFSWPRCLVSRILIFIVIKPILLFFLLSN
jgi:hypothetical protein